MRYRIHLGEYGCGFGVGVALLVVMQYSIRYYDTCYAAHMLLYCFDNIFSILYVDSLRCS